MTAGPAKVTLYLTLSEAAAVVERLTGKDSQPPLHELNAAADRPRLVAAVAVKAQRQLSFVCDSRARARARRATTGGAR